jgi:hypothetical protein
MDTSQQDKFVSHRNEALQKKISKYVDKSKQYQNFVHAKCRNHGTAIAKPTKNASNGI